MAHLRTSAPEKHRFSPHPRNKLGAGTAKPIAMASRSRRAAEFGIAGIRKGSDPAQAGFIPRLAEAARLSARR